MSIFIFFGFCFLVVLVSTIYVTVAFRNLLKKRKETSVSSGVLAEERK